MPDFTDYLFVDFENVPTVDLDLLRNKPVHVTLLIGAKQTKIPTALALQFRRFAAQVEPVEVGSSGRNALDITLAAYFGRALERSRTARFVIVSKDHDFDSMIAHFRSQNVALERVDTFASAPCFGPPKKARKSAPAKPAAPVAPALPAAPSPDPRTQKIIARLSNPQNKSQPRSLRSLRSHIKTSLGGDAADEQIDQVIDRLVSGKILKIGETQKIIYLP